MMSTPGKQLMSDDAEGGVNEKYPLPNDEEDSIAKLEIKNDNNRKILRLQIGQEALRYVFWIIAGSLFLSFSVYIFCGFKDIFETPVMTVVLTGLFGVLNLIIGFVAGTSID